MGISVKSRSRKPGAEGTYIAIPNKDLAKLDAACMAFACNPYFAFVVDEADTIHVYILSKSHLLALHPPGQKVISWTMRDIWTTKYATDASIKSFKFTTQTLNWWASKPHRALNKAARSARSTRSPRTGRREPR
jgi:hypothetical protein